MTKTQTIKDVIDEGHAGIEIFEYHVKTAHPEYWIRIVDYIPNKPHTLYEYVPGTVLKRFSVVLDEKEENIAIYECYSLADAFMKVAQVMKEAGL